MKEITPQNIHNYIRENFWLLVRYGISGMAGAISNLIIFSIAVEWFGVWYIFAALIGFVVAYAVTFSMHKWWTFAATAKERTSLQSLLYLASALGTLLVNTTLLYVLVEWFSLWPVLAQFLALGVSAVVSFIFTSQVTFHADSGRWEKFLAWCNRRYGRYLERWWYWPLMLMLILFVFMWLRLEYLPITFTSDADGYVTTAEYLVSGEGDFLGARYLKPLLPAVVAMISVIDHSSLPAALLTQAAIGYLTLALAAYWFGAVLFNDRRSGFLLGLMVATTYPVLRYGLDNYTETGAWTFYFLALSGTLLWYRAPQTKWLWFVALTLLLGLLWKEYAVLAGVVFGLAILFQPTLSWKEKGLVIIQGACLCLLPWFLWQYHVYQVYHYSYLDWFAIGASDEAYTTMYTPMAVIKSVAVLLTLSWLLVAVGIRYWQTLEKTVQRFLTFMLAPSFGFLLWGYVSSRLFFSLVPLTAPVAVHGLRKLVSFKVATSVLLCIGIINLGLVWFAFDPDIRAILNTMAYGDYGTAIEQSQ